MSVKLNEKFLTGFVAPEEVTKISHLTKAAFDVVKSRSGAERERIRQNKAPPL